MNISSLKEEVDQYLEKYFSKEREYNKVLYDSMAYSVNVGGKRVRPILMLLSYGIYKDDYKKILKASSAIEMIHTYSLIHDDLPCMDNDDLRRGKPTNHKVFGEAIAVLAGDALLNEAMKVLVDFSLEYGRDSLKATKIIMDAAGSDGMIGGQIVDIINEDKEEISLDELNYMHLKKTGELIKASIVSGAILAGASDIDIKKLEEYGYKLGLAFQIKDDILDVVGNAKDLGKKVNKDQEGHKNNYITIFGLEECKNKCISLTEECIDILNSIERNVDPLKELTMMLLERKF
ncbi:polyprenyl synthetase family protein [Clostridium sp.]|uniref:polyprenyl synthetase family protein n=1 Tax=Clostridium sp. TaxID=1506 RepID=UPI0026325BCD|nr:farnesyl diphosphate synthase [Clostridium sp.]